MFGRFLSFLGFIPGLSGLSGLAGYSSGMGGGSGAEDDLDADGEAVVSFTPGKPLMSADAEETPDSRRERITDRDLVWPGKVETIQISNPEPIAYRFDLTVTDLNPAFYIRRPPAGGVPQREGGVLLQPGEGASFEIVFVPPPGGEKLKTRTFSFVLTCFDPRRSSDPGEIVQDLPLRWVGLPTESDLLITASPPVVVTRPWRREAKFAVRFTNKGFLPSTVGMTILRAPTKDALERESEIVGTIQQSLAARTPGIWQCLLPPSTRRGSYYATVRGAAQAAASVSTPLALPRPVLIRYVPWLRMGRDWAALFGTLAFLLWLIWGFPAPKTPVVRVTLKFAGLKTGPMPPDSQISDLNAKMILLDERGHDQEGSPPIPGVPIENAYEFVVPRRLYGFRWPFGRRNWWNGWSQQPQRFRVTVEAAEAKKSAFKKYDLSALEADGTPFYQASDSESPWGPLVKKATFTARVNNGVIVNLKLDKLEKLAGRDLSDVRVTYTLGGHVTTETDTMSHDEKGSLRPIQLDLTDAVPLGESRPFTVMVTAGGFTSNPMNEIDVRRGEPRPIDLTFFRNASPKVSSKPNAGAEPGGQNAIIPPAPPPPAPLGQPAGSGPKPPAGGISFGGSPVASNKGMLPGSTHPLKPIPLHPSGSGHPAGLIPIQSSSLTPPQPQFQPAKITPPPLTVPPPPSDLRAENAGPGRIYVHWSPVPGATKYILYRSGGRGHGRGEEHLSADETSFTDTGLAPGLVYTYRVQSKNSVGRNPLEQSKPISLLTPALTTIPATVTLTLSRRGKDVQAILDFTNVSSQTTVYLDKVSACIGGKIGDNVFTVLENGQRVEFQGKLSHRPDDPSDSQFIRLLPGAVHQEKVILNHSYHLSSGTNSYSVTYSAPNAYPKRLQNLTLTSNTASLDTTP